MFTVVPHSSQLAHIDLLLFKYWELRTLQEEREDDSESTGEHSDSLSATSQDLFTTSGVVNNTDSESIQTSEGSPRTLSTPAVSPKKGQACDIPGSSPTVNKNKPIILSPCSVDSAFSSLPPLNSRGFETTDTSAHHQTTGSLTKSESPNRMLTPARPVSSFKFVEFAALHETNVVHRLPSSGDLNSTLSLEDVNSPKSSPRLTPRSRRRCIQCGGLILLADRKVANGQHWHQQCFKCATCGRFLDPGKHQEHDGQPYCKSCYTTLTQTVHRPVQPPQSPQEKNEIISRIKDYNLYKENSTDFIKYIEVGDNLVYEGVIKLYWGLRRHITLSSSDSAYRRQKGTRESVYNYVSIDDDGFSRMFENAQKSDVLSKEDLQELMGFSQNGIDGDGELTTQSLNESALAGMRKTDSGGSIPEEQREGDDYILVTQSDGEGGDYDSDPEHDYENVIPLKQHVVMRQKSDGTHTRGVPRVGLRRRSASFKKVQRQKKQAEAREQKRSRFIPPYGKPTNLRVSSIQGANEVLTMLLQKYKVENQPSEFALFVMHDSGAIEVLKSDDSPLAMRLKLGPSEDVAKIYVMESKDADKIVSQEAAEYIKFQIPELNLFLKKYTEEEEREVEKLKKWFDVWKSSITEQLQLQRNGES